MFFNQTPISVYQATESILTGRIMMWFSNLTKQDHKQLRRTEKTASGHSHQPLLTEGPVYHDVIMENSSHRAPLSVITPSLWNMLT